MSDECAKEGVPVPSTSHMSMIERGLVKPRPALRAVLARLLDLPDGIRYFDKDEASR